MPNIRQYDNTQVLRPDDMAAQATAQGAYHAEREAEIVPHLWEHGVQGISDAFKAYGEQQDQAQTTAMMKDMGVLTVQAHQSLTSALENGDTSSNVNPMEQFNTDLQAKLSAVQEKYGDNPKTNEVFQRMANELSVGVLDRGYAEWHDKVRSDITTNLQQMGSSFANSAALDPASVDRIAGMSDKSVQAMREQHPDAMGQADADKLMRSNRESIYNSAGMQIANALLANPNATAQDIGKVGILLAGDNFKNNMSPQDYNRVLDDIRKTYSTRQDAAALIMKDQLPSVLNQTEVGGDPNGHVAMFINAMPTRTPEEFAARTEAGIKYNDSLAAYQVHKQIGDLPDSQVQSFIAQKKQDYINQQDPMKASQARTEYDTAIRVAAKRDEEFHKDPSAYEINNNDTVGALWHNYMQDPKPTTFQTYAAFSAGQQQKLYPGSVPQILPPEMKRQIAGQLAQVDQTPEGAAQASKRLSDLQKTTGQFWNQAAHELYKDGIVGGTQFASAQLLGSPHSWSLAQEGFRAAAIPDKILTETSGIEKSTADKVASAALRPLLATFVDTTNGHELVGAYVNFISDVMRAHGKVDDATAASLAQTAVLDRFTIKKGMRIPSGMDADDVADGADNILANIHTHDLVIPPSFSGNGPAVQHDMYIDDIKDYGHWSTTPDGRGMTLVDQYGAPVYERVKGGTSKVIIPFETAANIGKGIRSPLNTLGRIVTNPQSVGPLPASDLGWSPSTP